jgi:protein subunit release factor A
MKNILDKLNAEQNDRLTRIEELKEQLKTPQVKDDSVETRKIQKKIRLLEAVVRSVSQVLSDEGTTNPNHPEDV